MSGLQKCNLFFDFFLGSKCFGPWLWGFAEAQTPAPQAFALKVHPAKFFKRKGPDLIPKI
jgi:hypothetical protein